MGLDKVPNLFRKVIRYHDMVYNLLDSHITKESVLSVGCGEGRMERVLRDKKRIDIQGLEVTQYENPAITVKLYDGKNLPVKDKSFDVVLFVYMLHHTNVIEHLLREAKRVARKNILILDHTYTNSVSKTLLKTYDYLSNVFYRMPIPFNFLKMQEWNSLFKKLDLDVVESSSPSPMNVFFKLTSL